MGGLSYNAVNNSLFDISNNQNPLKFLSLNVCGLKSRCINPDFISYLQSFHIIGLQETKLSEIDQINLNSFAVLTKNRKTKSRVPSGGIAIAVHESIIEHVTAIETESQLVFWFKLSCNFTKTTSDIICGVVYIPPENTRYSCNDPYTELQNELVSLCPDLNYCILFGDLNSRTGKLTEYIEIDNFLLTELGLEELENEYANELFYFETANISTQRTTTDKDTNNYGYKLIEFCKANSFYILNGRLGSDKNRGATTCRSASTVDYFICDTKLFPFAVNLYVDTYCPLLSDVHNPVILEIDFNLSDVSTNQNNTNEGINIKLWDETHPEYFVDNIDILKVIEVETSLTSIEDTDEITSFDIDQIANQISNVFIKSSETAFGYKKQPIISKKQKIGNKNNQPWFGKQCSEARKDFLNAKHRYNKVQNVENKSYLKNKGTKYKKAIHKHHSKYIKSKASHLRSLKNKNPKAFWRHLSKKNKNKCKISKEEYFKFMKDLNDTDTSNVPEQNEFENHEIPGFNFINDPITTEEIRLSVSNLSNGKACGLDNILNEHIKSSLHIMMPIYHKYFNLILNTGKYQSHGPRAA